MKSPAFAYRRARSLDEALGLLAEHDGEARILAGGQSLLAMMSFRLARPEVLIDIGRLDELRSIERTPAGLRIGALTTHRMLEMAPERATGPGFGVLRSAARWIGHYPIRTRGTIGGSVAHADPAAEWCMLAVALGAQIHVRSVAGERVIGAEAFFRGHYTTALRPEEMVVAIAFPEPAPHAALAEHARRHGDFALAAACVRLELSAGRIVHARVVLGGVAGTPLRVPEAERLLAGSTGRDSGVDAAARAAAAAVDPPADIHATSEHRRRLVAVLVRRACREAPASPTTWEGAHAAAA